MENLVPCLASRVTPDAAERLARHFNVGGRVVANASTILAGLAVARLAERAVTTEGAHRALESLPQKEEPGLLGSLLAAFKRDHPGETSAERMRTMFGDGVNSMVAALGRQLGFDPGPLASMLTPLFGQELAKTARDENLDAPAFANRLREGIDEFLAAPEHQETADAIRGVLAIGRQAEALQARFSAEELEDILTAPMAAYSIIAGASVSGIRSSMAEIKAAHQAGAEFLKDIEPISLLGSVFGAGLSTSEEAELNREIRREDELLVTISRASVVMKEKAPAEAETFRKLVLKVARRAAAAGKEGGFLGVGATRVSDEEKAEIKRISAALG